MTNNQDIYNILLEIKGDVSAVKQHVKDMNGKVKCHDTDIKTLRTKVAMASGGLSTLMLVLVILSYFKVL